MGVQPRPLHHSRSHHAERPGPSRRPLRPRKCSATNRLIIAKDHASVQINVAEVDESGKMTGSNVTYAFCGSVRETGDADDSLNRLATGDGLLKNVWQY